MFSAALPRKIQRAQRIIAFPHFIPLFSLDETSIFGKGEVKNKNEAKTPQEKAELVTDKLEEYESILKLHEKRKRLEEILGNVENTELKKRLEELI